MDLPDYAAADAAAEDVPGAEGAEGAEEGGPEAGGGGAARRTRCGGGERLCSPPDLPLDLGGGHR